MELIKGMVCEAGTARLPGCPLVVLAFKKQSCTSMTNKAVLPDTEGIAAKPTDNMKLLTAICVTRAYLLVRIFPA